MMSDAESECGGSSNSEIRAMSIIWRVLGVSAPVFGVLAMSGCAHHPADCAIGIPWSDCLEGTAGYNNGGGSETRLNALKLENASKQAPAPKPDLYTELNKPEDLKKRGLLTQEEFDAQKKKLLESQ